MSIRQPDTAASSRADNVRILDARTEAERKAIYHFRYQIQVEEMGRKIPGADHLRKRIVDDLDPWSCLAYAEQNGIVVGTVRLTVGSADDFPEELGRIFLLNRFREYKGESKNLGLGTKLMVHPFFRRTSVSFQLMAKGYELARQHAVEFSFSGSNPYLIPMYEQLGYRQLGSGFQDPGYGFIVPTLLVVEDVEHLTAVRSPYIRLARRLHNSFEAKHWLLAKIPEFAARPVGLLTSEQDCWKSVVRSIGDPLKTMPVLQSLNREEAQKLLHIATAFHCPREQHFIRQGDFCNELYILLSGEMDITEKAGGFRAKAGDIVGSVGLLEQTHHNVDAIAATDCELLAISRFSFEKLRRAVPQLAEKLKLCDTNEEGKQYGPQD